MTRILEDRIVVVTGGGAGIGLGIVKEAVRAGARVIAFESNSTCLAAVEQAGAEFVLTDVADVEQLQGSIQSVASRTGGLHGLVNCAATIVIQPILELTVEQMELMWRVNQRAVVIGCQAAARVMIDRACKGSIVNIASNHAYASDEGFEAYASTKGAVLALGRSLAWSLGKHHIRVNTLCPGLTCTEKLANELLEHPSRESRYRHWHATREISTVQEISSTAVFLLSDASSAMTGADLVADKGMTSRLGTTVV